MLRWIGPGALVAGVLVAWRPAPHVVVWTPAVPPPPRVEVTSPPIVVVQGVAQEPQRGPFDDLGPCTEPDPPADRKVGVSPGEGPWFDHALGAHQLEGVAVSSRRHGLIAAWSSERILFSDDDGRTFREILHGPGAVRGVTIDCHGRVFALRGGEAPHNAHVQHLGARGGGVEAWRRIDFVGAEDEWRRPSIVAEAGVVAVAGWDDGGTGILGTSLDGGETWRFFDLGWPDEIELAIDGRGRVQALTPWSDCMVDGIDLHAFDPRTGEEAAIDRQTGWREAILAADGWIYSTDCGRAVCAEAPASTGPRGVRGVTVTDDETTVGLVGNGRVVYAVHDGAVHRVEHRAATRIAKGVDELDLAPWSTVDSDGRLLGVDHGELIRWSPRHGATRIVGQRVPR